MDSKIHDLLRKKMAARAPAEVVDAILARCPDAECHECGAICCPYGEPLHFHHDGCPGCAEREGENP